MQAHDGGRTSRKNLAMPDCPGQNSSSWTSSTTSLATSASRTTTLFWTSRGADARFPPCVEASEVPAEARRIQQSCEHTVV